MFSPHPVFAENAKTTFPAGEGILRRGIANLVFSILLVIVASIGIDEPQANLSLPQRGRWHADVGGVADEENTNTFHSPSLEETNYNPPHINAELSYKVGPDFRLPDGILNTGILAGFNASEKPRHVVCKGAHGLKTFLVLHYLLGGVAVYLIPIL